MIDMTHLELLSIPANFEGLDTGIPQLKSGSPDTEIVEMLSYQKESWWAFWR